MLPQTTTKSYFYCYMKMTKQSAGILLYRMANKQAEVFLVHPGGPFWVKKDLGAWSIPKGEFIDEEPLEAAKREFEEETGVVLKATGFTKLTPVKLKTGKTVHAWAAAGDIDAATIKSNVFELEWPPKSGKVILVPEIDKAGWFTITEAKEKINASQAALIDELVRLLNI
jgi:predicted NUDIX family NTP pyrophosphohydrolase